MMKKKIKKIILICSIILPLLLILIVVIDYFVHPKNSSRLDTKEEVISYLENIFDDDNFEIIEKEKLNKKICNGTGYSWSVKSNKSGVTFDVYETEFHNNGTGECVDGVNDNYEEKTRDVFYNNEKLESDNKYNYTLYLEDYNSKEELADKIYGLIDKYYLKKRPLALRLIIKIEETNVVVIPEDVNSPKDIVNKYLGEK